MEKRLKYICYNVKNHLDSINIKSTLIELLDNDKHIKEQAGNFDVN